MKVIKTLETRLDISDTNSIFCTNINNIITDMLRHTYNGKCYRSTYILNVERIIKRGNIMCKNKVLDGSFYVDILFEASCLIYEKGEVIHNCKIIQINNTTIHAKSEFASLQIKNISKIDIFKENEEIPVIVNMVRYNLFETEIAVSAIPFIPIAHDIDIYKITDSEELEIKVDSHNIFNLEKELKQCNPKVIKFFKELIYPYNSYKAYNKTYKCDKKAITDSVELQNGDIVFLGDRYLNEDIYFIYKDDVSKIDNKPILSISLRNFIDHYTLEYKKNLYQLLDFCKTYDTVEKIKTNTHIWKMYNLLKK